MLSLISLLIIPIIFIGCVLIISNNFYWNINLIQTNNLKQISLLEETHFMIPYVLRRYYSYLLNIRSNLISSLVITSFWYNNMIYLKEKGLKYKNMLMTKSLKRIGLLLSILLYIIIILFWFKYRRTTLGYQLLTNTGSMKEAWNLNITLGLDSLSLPFVVLIGFIFPIVYLSNWSTIDKFDIYYIIIIIGLELCLIIVFLVIDLILFYVFFESILPLLFVLIGLYGAAQKFRAGYYLFLYTLFGSLFMLLTFLKMGGDSGSTFFEAYTIHSIFPALQEIIWIVLFVSFSVKTPLIPVHIWLPLAHSDANVSGSIVLASIVLKLALYGFLRILIAIFFLATMRLTPFFLGLCSMSVIYSSFTTIRQFDLKVLVAYSSIAHMASSLLGTFSDTLYGLIGSIIFGLAHGFVSPGLFIVVGAVLYDRCGSRIINYYRGLNTLLPLLAFLFLLLVFGNMGVPLTGNFVGEFLSLLGAYQQNLFIASIGALSIILSAVYSIFMYNRITSGSFSPYIHTIPDLFRKEYYILIPLLILTIILGIYPYFISSDIEFGLSNFLFSGNVLYLEISLIILIIILRKLISNLEINKWNTLSLI
jgi:NADH-ubiquinone oxidoreductase chain 4